MGILIIFKNKTLQCFILRKVQKETLVSFKEGLKGNLGFL
jgi:hypothetical protein